MIQRIQTVFLALAIVLNIIFLFMPMISHVLADPSAWIAYVIFGAQIISVVLSGYAISLFAKRKQQISWVKKAMLFQIIAVAAVIAIFFSMGRIGSQLMPEAIAIGLLILAVVFQYLAVYFINKDEKLVRSMDRIR